MSRPGELPMLDTAVVEPPSASLGDGARRFRVDGMDCAACAKTVEKTVSSVSGVVSAEVSLGTATMLVTGDAAEADVVRAVSRAGYRARSADGRIVEDDTAFWRRDVRAASTSASVVLLFVAVIASLLSVPREVAEPLYLLSMAVGGWPVARAAASRCGAGRWT